MAQQNTVYLQQSKRAANLAGSWKIAPGDAVTLRATKPGMLRVVHGGLYITLDGERIGAGNESGDYFLGLGQKLEIAAGQSAVIESWSVGDCNDASFSWEPVRCASTVAKAKLKDLLSSLPTALSGFVRKHAAF